MKNNFFKLIINVIFICLLLIMFILLLFEKYEEISIKNNSYNVEKIEVLNKNFKNYEEKQIEKNMIYQNNEKIIENYRGYNVVAKIEIPKIDLETYVLEIYSEETLKVAPVKFWGPNPNEVGNLCIAGHNYNNTMFFSNISYLNINDEINIYDNNEIKYIYYINSIYEVSDSDLSPILDSETNGKELTLITCNNFNSKRIIVKAKQKSP